MPTIAMRSAAMAPGSDLQGLFESHPNKQDFLTAGKVDDVIGLCLSGGGFRAMIYHVGVLVRLNELGLLSQVQEIASVSGGSIIAGKLAEVWKRLRFDDKGIALDFAEQVAEPILDFAAKAIDIKSILLGFLPGRSAADGVSNAYDRHLFGGATLQDAPDKPRFTFMATNLQTGSGWRFAKDYAADHRVGRIDHPDLPLSRVVAASSAFPPFLSPVRIEFAPGTVKPMAGADLHQSPFKDVAMLTDGGVYDNLGLERVWRRCRTVLVSNAGKNTPELGSPTGRWGGQVFRTLALVQQQAENSRKRILFGLHNAGQRRVAYWGIDTPIADYGVSESLPFSKGDTIRTATMRTRLNAFSGEEIDILLKAGYAGCDASLRSRQIVSNDPPAAFSQLPLRSARSGLNI
jgi:NTE family protein